MPRYPVHLYLDECQHLAGRSLTDMLAEIRKFSVSLILANQYLAQHTPEMQAAILGTVRTFVAYSLSPDDARRLEPEFKLREDEATPSPICRPTRPTRGPTGIRSRP